MNLNDLSKIDIKDLQKIDYTQLAKEFRKRPDTAIIIAAVLLSLLLSAHLFSKNKKMSFVLKSEVKKLEEKVAALDAYNESQAELKKFQNAVPEHMSDENLINIVSNIAIKRNIQILSLMPGQKKEETYYDLVTLTLQIESIDYRNLWLFVHDIENNDPSLRIDEWIGSMEEISLRTRRRQPGENETNKIQVQLTISIVNYKNV